jgi:hypothetical protein
MGTRINREHLSQRFLVFLQEKYISCSLYLFGFIPRMFNTGAVLRSSLFSVSIVGDSQGSGSEPKSRPQYLVFCRASNYQENRKGNKYKELGKGQWSHNLFYVNSFRPPPLKKTSGGRPHPAPSRSINWGDFHGRSGETGGPPSMNTTPLDRGSPFLFLFRRGARGVINRVEGHAQAH